MKRSREVFLLAGILLLAAILFFTGIGWGLPSRESDRFLFASEPVWTGEKINSLLPKASESIGADVDVDPQADRSHAIILNATDEQKAQIIMRYRLYSHQPDEMITFRALSQMKPGQFKLDPRLYQYGGLWTYPVGALLKVSSVLGFVHIKSDRTFYLDHPEEFGRFYIVARAYSAAWGLIGMLVVYYISKRLSGRALSALLCATAFAFLPVVINQAHEAKPHLAGTVLMLLTCAGAMRYMHHGRTRDAIVVGILAGCSVGMVLSAAIIGIVIPIMLLRNPASFIKNGLLAIAFMLLTYCITNPYVPYHLLTNPTTLQSNLGNSKAMYHVSNLGEGASVTFRLLGEGMGMPLMMLGIMGAITATKQCLARTTTERSHEATMDRWYAVSVILAPALLVIIQMTLLGAGKPAEFGRFGLFADVALSIAAIRLLSITPSRRTILIVVIACMMWTALNGVIYVGSFLWDSSRLNSRTLLADELQSRTPAEKTVLSLPREPAPYNCPPVDVFRWKMQLIPTSGWTQGQNEIYIAPIESILPGHVLEPGISWADKRFEVK